MVVGVSLEFTNGIKHLGSNFPFDPPLVPYFSPVFDKAPDEGGSTEGWVFRIDQHDHGREIVATRR